MLVERSPLQIWGSDPLGGIFSNFFSRYRSENLSESWPRPRKNYANKFFGPGPSWARGHSLKGDRITFFECSHTSVGHSSRDIAMKFCSQIALGEQ